MAILADIWRLSLLPPSITARLPGFWWLAAGFCLLLLVYTYFKGNFGAKLRRHGHPCLD